MQKSLKTTFSALFLDKPGFHIHATNISSSTWQPFGFKPAHLPEHLNGLETLYELRKISRGDTSQAAGAFCSLEADSV